MPFKDSSARQQELERQRLEHRFAVQRMVQRRFTKFGDDICNHLKQAAPDPHAMLRVLEKLGLPPVQQLDRQLARIEAFVANYGSDEYCKRLHVTSMNELRKARRSQLEQLQNEMRNSDRNHVESELKSSLSELEHELLGHAIQPAEQSNVADLPSPSDIESIPEDLPAPESFFDDQGKYVGPERRVNAEDRRKNQDRRDKIELIRQNKRFGGERRRIKRRKADR
ncbi:hypothetical protein JXA32_14585 [Candidatus Sumerlaeota bacterium]|nr:hypothetical protein [Candidatus Sumerlaeota bacterium]